MHADSTNRIDLNVLLTDDAPLIQKRIKSTLGILGVRNIDVAADEKKG